jgi:hypothetical protein
MIAISNAKAKHTRFGATRHIAFGREQDTWNWRLDFVSGFAVPLLKPGVIRMRLRMGR